jgi:hypothetical protein
MDRSIDGGSSAGKGQLRVLALGMRARSWTLAEVQRSVRYEGREKHTHQKFNANQRTLCTSPFPSVPSINSTQVSYLPYFLLSRVSLEDFVMYPNVNL